MKNIATISPGQIAGALSATSSAGLTAMFWGDSGIGKSEGVQEFCVQQNRKLTDLRISTMDPTDIRGLTFIDKTTKRTVVFRPGFLPDDPNSCIFLDEINRGDPFTQNAALQLVLDYRVADYVVPKGGLVCAAGNFSDSGQSVTKMDVAMNDRLVHYHVVPNIEDFLKWGVSKGIHPSVLAFLKMKNEYLYRGPDFADLDPTSYKFPTPRSWARVSKVLQANGSLTEVVKATISGIVGDAAASHYFALLNHLGKIPEPKELLAMKPAAAAKHPGLQHTSALWGVLYTLLSYAGDKYDRYEKSLELFFAVASIKDDLPREEILALAIEIYGKKMFEIGGTQRMMAFVDTPAIRPWFDKNLAIKKTLKALQTSQTSAGA